MRKYWDIQIFVQVWAQPSLFPACSTLFVEQDSYVACEEAGALQQKLEVKGLLQTNQLKAGILNALTPAWPELASLLT